MRALAVLTLVASLLGVSVVSAQPAQATNCSGQTWPSHGALQTSNWPGSNGYSVTFQFTLSADELCSLQQTAPYLELDMSIQNFNLAGSWEGYSLSNSNLPGGIHDVAYNNPQYEPNPAITRIYTSQLQAGVNYHVTMSWFANARSGMTPYIKFVWTPSYWARTSDSYEDWSCRVAGNNNINSPGSSSNPNEAWCIFPYNPQAATLFGNQAFAGGFSNGHVPLGGFLWYTWGPSSTVGSGVNPAPPAPAPAPPPPPPSVGTKMMGDVNGDGRADAVVMFSDSGTAMVALGQSNGTFGFPNAWSYGHSLNREYYLGDVNGDGMDDLVAFTNSGGYWDVSLSSGTGFWTPTQWANNEGAGSSKRFLADVEGDGKDDVVFFVASTGKWYVDFSSGSGFYGPPVEWISGHGVGSNNQLMGDFNGDGKADAAIFVKSTGSWYVSLSTGSSFGYPGQWSYGHGNSSTEQLVGNADGVGGDDIVYHYSNGHWSVGTSSGSGFYTPSDWSYDASGYVSPAPDKAFIADVEGDGKADKVIYYNGPGNWYVGFSSGSGFYAYHDGVSGHGANS